MPLRDEIAPVHIKRIEYFKVTRFLDMEVPLKNEKIVEGKWKLTENEKTEAINRYYGLNHEETIKLLAKFNVTEHFEFVLNESFIDKDYKLNIKSPSLLDLTYLYNNTKFKTISGETKDKFKFLKDEGGKPILDENGEIVKVEKDENEIIWNNKFGNINDFIKTYNKAFPNLPSIFNPFLQPPYSSIPSMTGNFNMDMFAKCDMYLYISSRPMDILNQSMTSYYQSCQTIYREDFKPLLANVMDKNTKICFLMFDTPWTDTKKVVYPFTPFSRMFIRVVGSKIFFDCVYPNRSINFLHKIVEEKTGMKNQYKSGEYKYTTPDEYAVHSYMDILKPVWKKEISIEELLKDIRLRNLSNYLKINPTEIDRIEDKVYETEKGKFIIFTDDEIYNYTVESIKNIVYKQNIYSKYLNLENFFKAEKKSQFLSKFKGDKTFDSIFKHSEKIKFSKHNLYRLLKPYLDESFWASRLTKVKILKKISTYSSITPIDIGDDFKAYIPIVKEKKEK